MWKAIVGGVLASGFLVGAAKAKQQRVEPEVRCGVIYVISTDSIMTPEGPKAGLFAYFRRGPDFDDDGNTITPEFPEAIVCTKQFRKS